MMLPAIGYTHSPNFNDTRWDSEIIALIKQAHAQADTLDSRIDYLSEHFVAQGNAYVGEPLCEGPSGRFSQRPLYRLDFFDCTTFI